MFTTFGETPPSLFAGSETSMNGINFWQKINLVFITQNFLREKKNYSTFIFLKICLCKQGHVQSLYIILHLLKNVLDPKRHRILHEYVLVAYKAIRKSIYEYLFYSILRQFTQLRKFELVTHQDRRIIGMG